MSKKIFNYCMLFSTVALGAQAKDIENIYIVQKNDTLNKIAKKNNLNLERLLKLNNIKNPNLIYPNMRLIIEEEQIEQEEYEVEYYVVEKNDTLSKIAKKLRIDISEIMRLNSIENPNLIYPNMKLKIRRDSNQIEERKDSSKEIKYIVEKNDNLNKIAKKFEISIGDIVKLNNIEDINLIYPGQELKIPSNEKILKIEVSPKSHLEIYYKGKIIGYKTTEDQAIINVKGDTIKLGEKLELKLYDDKGQVKEKSIEVSEEKINFISFVDNNNDKILGLEDELLTLGTYTIDKQEIPISTSGKTEIPNIEVGKTYDIVVNSKSKNIINKNFTVKVDGKDVYIPIENNVLAVTGKMKITKKSFFSTSEVKYDTLLLRLKSLTGEEISVLPIDENGNFYIDEILKGEYLYDIEEISHSKLKTLEKDKKLNIDKSEIQIELVIKKGIL